MEKSLNPFFIRASFQSKERKQSKLALGLNPFFIRASFQRIHQSINLSRIVLIPSSSGQVFKGGFWLMDNHGPS